jgi:hypothetical protein
MSADEPLTFVVADGLTIGESDGLPVVIVRKEGFPPLGVVLPFLARAALVAGLEDFARRAGGPAHDAPMIQ